MTIFAMVGVSGDAIDTPLICFTICCYKENYIPLQQISKDVLKKLCIGLSVFCDVFLDTYFDSFV